MTTKKTTKPDEIKILIVGTKKFRQMIIDKVYSVLMTDEMQVEYTKPGCGLNFDSSISPSDEVMI